MFVPLWRTFVRQALIVAIPAQVDCTSPSKPTRLVHLLEDPRAVGKVENHHSFVKH